MNKLMYRKNRKNGKKAFTLAEMLIALLIMSLAGLIVISGIAAVSRAFQDIILHSQAQMVLKEYMGEVRSGFLSANLDAEVTVDGNDSRPAFVHSGFDCAGYFTVVRKTKTESSGTVTETELLEGDSDDCFGAIVFRPVYVDYGTHKAVKDSRDQKEPKALISTKFANDFLAKIDYTFNESTQMFTGTITIKSVHTLSSGEHVELSGGFSVSPACRSTSTGGGS